MSRRHEGLDDFNTNHNILSDVCIVVERNLDVSLNARGNRNDSSISFVLIGHGT